MINNKNKHTNFGTKTRQINYLVNNFQDFKQSALLRLRQYYPNRANQFAPDSDGDIFLQLNRRIGDILKFQLNQALNQSQLNSAINQDNIFQIGKANGFYNIKNTPAFGFIDVSYQVSTRYVTTRGTITADQYIPTIKRGSTITINGDVQYIINNDIIFVGDSSTAGDQQIQILSDRSAYTVTKKDVFIMRGSFQQFNIVIDQAQSLGKFFRVQLPRQDIMQITNVQTGQQRRGTDEAVFADQSNLNNWYQYPYLAQKSIFQVTMQSGVQRVTQIDTPYKYVLQYDADGNSFLVFGPGRSFINNANNVTAFRNVYAPISGYIGVRQEAISPESFLFSSSLGYSPGDTNNKVMRIKYIFGGGPNTNVEAGTQFQTSEITFNSLPLSAQQQILNTMIITNTDQIAGGIQKRNTQEVKQIIKRYGNSQQRVVNTQDYVRRIKSRPNIYGGNISVNVFKNGGFINIYLANKTAQNQVAQFLTAPIKRLNKVHLTRYLRKYTMLDDTFQIQYRDVKNIIVNFQVSIYDYQNKQNVQNDIAIKILQLFQQGIVKFDVGQDVDFNIVIDAIRDSFRAVKSMGQVVVIDKDTGRSLSVVNNVLNAVNRKTIYNVQDYMSDITVSLI